MWVNKEFISNLNQVLRSVAEEGSAIDLAVFDVFKAKKYQSTIDLLKNFHFDHQVIRSEINDILNEKYRSHPSENDDKAPEIYKLKTINRNLKNLIDDLQKTSIALSSKKYEIILPARGDHRDLRDSFNGSLRNVSNHVNQLNLEIDRRGKEIDRFRKTTGDRKQYLGKVIGAVNNMASGEDSVEIPWSDQDQEMFSALQEVRTVLRRTVRFLGDLASGIPSEEKIPFPPDSQFGSILYEVAESVKALSHKLSQSDQLIRRLEKENSETSQFIELVTYYIEGIAIGDYTQGVPFKEDQPILVAALEQVKKSFEEISDAALEAAKGDFNQQEILPEHHGLVRSAFKQMLQSFKTRQNQLTELIKDKSTQVSEGQNQLKELLDYNIKFEKQFESLAAQYEQTILEQQEQNRVLDRVQKKNERLEEELKSLKQKYGSQTKQVKTLQDEKERLQNSNKRSSLYVKNVLGDLNKHLTQINTLVDKEQKKAEASKSSLPPLIKKMGKRSADIRDTITKTFAELEKTRQDVNTSEIDLELFIQELQLELKDFELESGNTIEFEIEETAPRLIYSDEIRLKYILQIVSQHSLKNATAGQVNCRVYRATSDLKTGGSQPMIGFEIQANNDIPISGQQLVLEAFDGLYEIHRSDWDDVNLGLNLLRELSGAIDGELNLHSIQGHNDTYLLLIPLNLGAAKEKSPALVTSLPESNENVIFVLEDDARFMNSVASGFGQGNYKCLQLSSLEEAIDQSKQNMPFAICLGVKWAGEPGKKCMQTISQNTNGNRIPFIALTETPKIPEEWSRHCIGYLEKTTGSNDYQTMIERIKAYRKNYRPNLAILAQQNEIDTRIKPFVKNFDLESEIIVNMDTPADPVHKSHLLVMSNGENPSVEIAEKLVGQYRQKCPSLSVISGAVGSSNYLFRNRLEPLSDAFIELDQIEDDLLYEIIRLLQLSENQLVKDNQQNMAEYLKSRNNLLKDKNALMITEDAASTMALRKQLNQLGMVIRVNTKVNKIIDGLDSQARCDLVIINSIKSERDMVRIVGEIRKSKNYKMLPILLMSNSAQLGDEEYWREKGASYFLPGPAQFDSLLSAVRISIGSQLLV